MKANVNYEIFYKALEKFSEGKEITVKEKQTLLNVLNAAIGQFVPTIDEIENYKHNFDLLSKLTPNTKPWNKAFLECVKFYV